MTEPANDRYGVTNHLRRWHMNTMKLIGKVVLVFVVWVSLGAGLRAIWPEAHERFGMGTSAREPSHVAMLQNRYSMIVSNLTAIGLRSEGEVVVPTKRETHFAGTYGNVSDIQIDVSFGKSPSGDFTSLWVHSKCTHPRWKDGGKKDYRLLKEKLDTMMRE